MSNEVKSGLDAANEATADVYSTKGALEIYNDKTEQPPIIWGGLSLTAGELMEIIGPAGLGKSRLVLNLAIWQILGRDFAGLPTYRPPEGEPPLNWLFYGNENSIFRFRHDLRGMFSILRAEERERVGKHLFLPTMENPEDCFISFAEPRNLNKFYATIVQRDASVVVMDPWGAIIAGDELSDGDVRQTILEITRKLHEAAAKLKHPVVGIILNHSRNGIRELVNACGPNAANYGKNSKAIFSVVRTVWNLRPGDVKENSNKIELIHAKGNDIQKYDYICVKLNPNSMCYEEVPNFDHKDHQRNLEDAERRGSALTPNEKKSVDEKRAAENKEKMLRYFNNSVVPVYKSIFDEWAKNDLGLNEEKRQKLYGELVSEGKLAEILERRSGGKKLVWTTEKMMTFLTEKGPDKYKQVSQPPPSGTTSGEVGNVPSDPLPLGDDSATAP